MQTFAGDKFERVLPSRVAAGEIDLTDVDDSGDVEALELRLRKDRGFVEVIDLFAGDLKKERDFGIEMEGRNGRGGADQNRRGETHDPLAAETSTHFGDLVEKRLQKFPEARVVLFGPLQENARLRRLEPVEGLERRARAARHGVELGSRRARAACHEEVALVRAGERPQRAFAEELEGAESVLEPERLAVVLFRALADVAHQGRCRKQHR